jgi:hypothetical protein
MPKMFRILSLVIPYGIKNIETYFLDCIFNTNSKNNDYYMLIFPKGTRQVISS